MINSKFKRKINHKFFLGFTLAEVLIVLGIIGIIAEVTIPDLVQQTQDRELKAAWKTSYSELSQVMTSLIMDNGGQDLSGMCSMTFDNTCLRDLFVNKMKVAQKCYDSQQPANRTPAEIAEAASESDGTACFSTSSKWMDNTTTLHYSIDVNTKWPSIISLSGYSVKFRYHDCSSSTYAPQNCGWMQIDVNGLKQPNIAGKDIFFIGIGLNRLFPLGSSTDTTTYTGNDCSASGSGIICSSQYLWN